MSSSDRPHFIIDPGVQFGRVCVPNTRIPAGSLSSCVAAGDPVDSVADDYNVPRLDVILSCWWAAEEARHQRRRTVYEKRLLDAWDDWALGAGKVLAGWDVGPISDPPEVTL